MPVPPTTQNARLRLYTNDLEVERAKQSRNDQDENRLAVLRNRISRSKRAANLVVIALVANERNDSVVEREACARLVELDALTPDQSLEDVKAIVEIVESRRASRSKVAHELGIAAPPAQTETSEPDDTAAPASDERIETS